MVVTSYNAFVRLKFTDGGEVTLRPNTQLRIDRYHFEPARPEEDSLVFALLKGGLRTITGLLGKRKEHSYELQTVTATIGIRGTGYGIQFCQGDCQDLRTVDGRVPDRWRPRGRLRGAGGGRQSGGRAVCSRRRLRLRRQERRRPRQGSARRRGADADTELRYGPQGSGLDGACVVP